MTLSPLLLRVLLVLITLPFWASGLLKLSDVSATIAEVARLGVPFPTLGALATIAVQLLGSLSLVAGRFAGAGAAGLIVFTLLASVMAHPFWALPPEAFMPNFAAFTANMGLVGGLIAALILSHASQEASP